MERKIDLLIEGAGPTGLVLALCLVQKGIRIRIIDKAPAPGTASRALAVHARTLEFYQQLGIACEAVERGYPFPAIDLWVGRQRRARVEIGEAGATISPFAYVLMFPQDQHERLLTECLRRWGVEVDRSTELLAFSEEGGGLRARIRRPDGTSELCTAEYLAGCDGAHSFVRETLGIDFSGTTYPGQFFVADIVGSGPALNGDLNVALDESEFLAIFPLKERGHARLIGVAREKEDGRQCRWEDVHPRVVKDLDFAIEAVRWFSLYRVHHRVASRFQAGRVFLLGDAAHIHSPVGGQGMNTGIGDAVNLAWKLEEVLEGRAPSGILATYESERIAFARRLVQTTDRLFSLISARGPWARLVRTAIAPWLLERVFQFAASRRFFFRTVSQTGLAYRHSSLSQGGRGRIRGGDRLPWVASADNFAPLESREWQVHAYGAPLAGLESCGAPFHRFEWSEEMAQKGLRAGAAYLVRPDGYIGLVAASAGEVRDYLARLGIRIEKRSGAQKAG